MTGKKMFLVVTAVAVFAFAYFGWRVTARAEYESAEYEVVHADGKFEVRKYPELTLVTTQSKIDARGRDGSFMRLFRYISGNNESEQKVAMTTPVFMESDGNGSKGKMSFVIPKGVAEKKVPVPSAEDVLLQKRSGGNFAVIRFSGRMTPESAQKAEEKLREWCKENDLKANDDSETAGYDPPWTPGLLRRNEVLIRLNIDQ